MMEDNKDLQLYFERNFQSFKGKDGRYFTRLPNGKQIRTSNKAKFIREVMNYYDSAIGTIKKLKQPKVCYGIEACMYEWIEFKARYEKVAQGTIDRTKKDYFRFFVNNPLAQPLMCKNMIDIGEEELELFVRGTICDMELTAKSWAKLKALINGIWLFAMRKKVTDIYITKFFDVLSIKPKMLRQQYQSEARQVFTDEEARTILDEIDKRDFSLHNYGIVLGFYTGMRIGEISGLKWSDVADDFSKIFVNHMEILYENEDGKKNHYEVVDHAKTKAGIRKVIIPDELVPYLTKLKEYSGDREFVFSDENGRRLHARSFSDKLTRLCEQLNMTPRRMHKVRKTVCSKMCDSGVDDRLLLNQIGHTDRKTTEEFYHRDRRTDNEKRDIISSVLVY